MSAGSSGGKPEDGQPAQESWVARSNWVNEALGSEWVEVEPGIYRQLPREDPAPPEPPPAKAEPTSIDQTLRDAIDALTVDAETASTDP